jgi:hypothetical protein
MHIYKQPRPPQIIKGIKAGVDGIKNGIPAAATAIATSGATRGAIAYFADKVRGGGQVDRRGI